MRPAPRPERPRPTPREGLVELRELSRVYGTGPKPVRALDEVALSIPRGDFVVLLGPSGSGKTTLLNVVGGIETATRGEVRVDGERIDGLGRSALTEYRRRKVGFVFQFFNLVPSLTALENVELAARLSPAAMPATTALERVGLGERLEHFPSELSGGEQQRVAIARAVVRRPPLLLADEPTGELDDENGRRVLTLLREMNRELGMTVLLVTHNGAIAEMADRVVRMRGGKVASVRENERPVEAHALRW